MGYLHVNGQHIHILCIWMSHHAKQKHYMTRICVEDDLDKILSKHLNNPVWTWWLMADRQNERCHMIWEIKRRNFTRTDVFTNFLVCSFCWDYVCNGKQKKQTSHINFHIIFSVISSTSKFFAPIIYKVKIYFNIKSNKSRNRAQQ